MKAAAVVITGKGSLALGSFGDCDGRCEGEIASSNAP